MQTEILGRQIFGKRQVKYFLDSFAKATAEKFRCLLVDLSPHSDPTYKLRSYILPGQLIIVYLPENPRSVNNSISAGKGNMNPLIKKERYFLILLVSTTVKQKKALLRAIEKSQLRAIVQIVYNLMTGYRALPENERKRLARRKTVIRQFVSQGISLKKRKELLLKYYKYILPFISAIQGQLFNNGRQGARTRSKK